MAAKPDDSEPLLLSQVSVQVDDEDTCKEIQPVNQAENQNINATMTGVGNVYDIRENLGEGVPVMTKFKTLLNETIEGSLTAEPEDIRLLVVGRTGEGKSTLINSIIGFEIVKEGRVDADPSIQQYFYRDVIPGVNITLIDSSGLLQDIHQAEQSYIQLMKNECPEVNLVLYCMKMTDHHFRNEDKLAMQKLHQAFGPKFWERVVFVLTFEDGEQGDVQLRLDDSHAQVIIERVRNWKLNIKDFLLKNISVKLDTVHCVLAGSYEVFESQPNLFQLPDRENWLHDLLKLCCLQIKNHKFNTLDLRISADLVDSINIREKSGGAAMKTLKEVLRQVMELSTESQDLRLLVVGKTGEGKSTLINSIIDLPDIEEPFAEEGYSLEMCTHSVQQYIYPNVISGVNFMIVDTPGLEDIHKAEQSYIQAMKIKCKEVSLILYCINVTARRLKNEDKLAMQKLHQAFGPKFWERVVFVLTFANDVNCDPRRGSRDSQLPPNASKAQVFDSHMQIFASKVKKFLSETTGVKSDTIPCVPAGDYRGTDSQPNPLQLPDREDWLNELLRKCCLQIKDHNFTKISLNDKIHLAFIINNDGDVIVDKNGKMTEQMNRQTTEMNEALEKLGFCVLHFNCLSSQSIAWLLKSLQHVNHSELASFALVILSKGKTHHVYDVNNEQVSFENLFDITVPVPKLFFFHLSLLEKPPKDELAFNDVKLSKNSIALAVSVCESGTLAIDSFINCLKSSKPLKQCFKDVKNAVKDRCVSTILSVKLDDDYVLPTPYIPSVDRQKKDFLKKQLELHRALWHPVRCQTVDVLLATKDEVMAIVREERITKIAASTASIAIGGGLVVAGIIAAPFTLGASLGLAIAGGIVGAATGIAGVSAFIKSRIKSNKRLKKAQQHVHLDQQVSKNLNVVAAKYFETLESYASKIALEVTGGVGSGISSLSRFGMTVAVGTEGAIETSAIAIRSTGRIAGMVTAGATLAVTVPIDVGFIIYNSILLHKSSEDKSGKSDRDAVIKWFVKQTEELLKGTFTSVDVKEYSIIFENPECGYVIRIPSVAILSVRTILAGPFVVPEGYTLVSAVYDFLIQKKQASFLSSFISGEKLKAPITIEIEHCVDITDQSTAEKMTFATATVDFDKKAFVFTPLEGGTFPQGEAQGSISLSDSSLMCILLKNETQEQKNQQMMKYAAHCSTTRECRNYWKTDTTFTKCLSVHYKYFKMEHPDITASYPFKITSDAINDVPCIKLDDLPVTKNGWKISHHVLPHNVDKKELDTAELHKFNKTYSGMVPSLQLDIQVEDEERASDELRTSIEVTGTDLRLDITQSKET